MDNATVSSDQLLATDRTTKMKPCGRDQSRATVRPIDEQRDERIELKRIVNAITNFLFLRMQTEHVAFGINR